MNNKNIAFVAYAILALFLALQVWVWFRYAGAFWLSDSMSSLSYLIKSVDPLKTSTEAVLILVVPALVLSYLIQRGLPLVLRFVFYVLLGATFSELYLFYMAKFNMVFIMRQIWVYFGAGGIAGFTYGVIMMLPWGTRPSTGDDVGVSQRRRKLVGSLGLSASVAGLFGSLAGPIYFWMNRNEYVDVDVGLLKEGQMMIVEVANKPVWILKRSPDVIRMLKHDEQQLLDPQSEFSQQPEEAKNSLRSIRPEYLVVYGICTHLGCSPTYRATGMSSKEPSPSTAPQFFCPCHGGAFDLAGRVYKGTPPPVNMVVPDYKFITDETIRLFFPSIAEEWNA